MCKISQSNLAKIQSLACVEWCARVWKVCVMSRRSYITSSVVYVSMVESEFFSMSLSKDWGSVKGIVCSPLNTEGVTPWQSLIKITSRVLCLEGPSCLFLTLLRGDSEKVYFKIQLYFLLHSQAKIVTYLYPLKIAHGCFIKKKMFCHFHVIGLSQ